MFLQVNAHRHVDGANKYYVRAKPSVEVHNGFVVGTKERLVNTEPKTSYEEASRLWGTFILKDEGIKPKNGGKYLAYNAFLSSQRR